MKFISTMVTTLLLAGSVFAAIADTTFIDLVKEATLEQASKNSNEVTLCIRKCLMNGEEYHESLARCS